MGAVKWLTSLYHGHLITRRHDAARPCVDHKAPELGTDGETLTLNTTGTWCALVHFSRRGRHRTVCFTVGHLAHA